MLTNNDILQTIKMIEEEDLDIRTITMGISLIDCIDSDINKSCEKIYNKITRYAKNLVKVCKDIEKEYGIPIVNQRISVTPIALLLGASGGNPLLYAQTLDRVADELDIDFIGGFSALVDSGYAPGDLELINAIPEVLSKTKHLCSSVNIGSTKSGINLDACKKMGEIVYQCADMTKDNDCLGAAKLVVFCNSVDDNPFMAGAYHGIKEKDVVINVGVSGPGVVRYALSKAPKDLPINEIAEIIKKTAFKITRMGQLVGTIASERLGVPFGIVDLSLAPTPAVGDSVAYILEEMGLEKCGTHGTTACLALLNDAVKKGGVMAATNCGGLSGAFIPVSEDAGMIGALKAGSLTLEKLEAMTAVCSVGLDMIVLPSYTKPTTIAAIIADEAAIGMVNNKTTACRLIPAIGKNDDEMLSFGGLLGESPIMKINQYGSDVFINRGGKIPAPLQSLKN